MKLKRFLLFITLFVFSIINVFSQANFSQNNSDLDYGIAAKLNIEIGKRFTGAPFSLKNFYRPGFKLSITGGVGYKTNGALSFYPTIHSGVLIFNKSSIGANQSKNAAAFQYHFFINAIATVQLDKKDFTYALRNLPFYHFAEFTANPLQNPYKSSISLGANWVVLKKGSTQKIGFLNVNVVGRAQITYYNDGGFLLKCFGDKRDRYYTGGLILSYHGNYNDKFDLLEFSYHKFTGYQKNAFDIADKLQIDFLNYKDTVQFAYNQQRLRINLSSLKTGFGGSLSLYNYNSLDLQDFLHFKQHVPYHPDYFRGYRVMLGGRFQTNYINLSK